MIAALFGAAVAYLIGSLPSHQASRFVPQRFSPLVAPLLDVLKGAVSVAWLPGEPGVLVQTLAATAVLAGVQWPIFGNHGRRGLAAAAGALSLITPIAAPLWLLLCGIAYVATGYAAVGRAAASLLLPVTLGLVGGWAFGLAMIPCCLMLLDRDRPAMRRVLLGTEPRHLWRPEG